MWAALGYLLGGGLLAAAIGVAGRRVAEPDLDNPTFRYDLSRVVWCAVALGAGVLLAACWMLAGLALGTTQGVIDYAVGWVALAGLAATYVYCRTYAIDATQDSLVVHGLTGTRSIPYRDIREVVLKDGAGRSGALLELMDSGGKRVLSVSSSFDTLGLAGIVRSRTAKYGVRFRHRDARGQWQSP